MWQKSEPVPLYHPLAGVVSRGESWFSCKNTAAGKHGNAGAQSHAVPGDSGKPPRKLKADKIEKVVEGPNTKRQETLDVDDYLEMDSLKNTAAGRDEKLVGVNGAGKVGSAADSIYSSMRPMGNEFPELRGVNPHYVENAGPGVNTNCVSCVNAAQQRLSGQAADAVADATRYGNQNGLLPSAPFGFGPTTTPAVVMDEMLAAGDGAARPFIIQQPGNVQHVINVVNRNGQVHFIDSQMGQVVTLHPTIPVKLGRP